MYLRSMTLNNFKCFESGVDPLNFAMPDGATLGSGLNIFVGENNTGKSTIFEALDFVRNGPPRGKSISDLRNKGASSGNGVSVTIDFGGAVTDVIDAYAQKNKQAAIKQYVSDNTLRVVRSSDNEKELLLWDASAGEFKNESGIDAPIKKLFELDFIWADTNPNDEAKFGATTICGKLLKEISKSFAETDEFKHFQDAYGHAFNDPDSVLKKQLCEIERRTQEIFEAQFGKASISFHFDELQIDNFFKNTRIKVDDGLDTYLEEKGSGMQRSVALALIQVYAESLIKHPDNLKDKPFFLVIDEPETCLHPIAQLKLFEALAEISKRRQVFVATHSPYMFKNCLSLSSGLFLCIRDGSKITVTDVRAGGVGLFPWSPSWGEINYNAYNLPTIEFHNELYGFLQEQAQLIRCDDFDQYLQNCKHITQLRPYSRNGSTGNVTLCTYVRHQIHHPENTANSRFADTELKQSIDLLINAIRNP